MNRIFYTSAEAFLFRLSDNAEHYKSDKGIFKVTFRQSRSRKFPTLVEAFLFYITLDDEAELWDVTKAYTLIERKAKLYLN